MQSFYQFSTEEVLDQLKTSASGLKTEAVHALQKKYGANVLQEAKQKTKLAILLSQFTDIMIIILVIAAIISFVGGEHTDAFVILHHNWQCMDGILPGV
jgi:Ca2+-transporting ATPase